MSGDSWQGEVLADKFAELTELLLENQRWWRPRAFFQKQLPWEITCPELSSLLRQMPLSQSEQLAPDNQALADFFRHWIPAASALPDLVAVPKARMTTARTSLDEKLREPVGVPGRKWQQIQAFVSNLKTTELPAVEWCAGKAHVSRWYAQQSGMTVDALEWNAELVEAGNRLSLREHLPVHVHHVDVLSPQSKNYLHDERQVLALHACGQLHIRLLQLCAHENRVDAIALAPCCYQLIPQDNYQPLSDAARAANLPLTKLDLHTAVQESVTSPERVLKQRRQLQAWRLGFDLLQRDVRDVDAYMHAPSEPLSILHKGFQHFCERMAVAKNVVLPLHLDLPAYEQKGEQRFIEVNALDLPRVLFRRALELWLVLDRALYLQESEYSVSVGTFCERTLTPRNLLIQAVR